MEKEYKDYCFQDFTDADRIRVREDYWKEYDKIMESYRGINAEYDVARAIIEELAPIYHTDTSTIMTILSKGKKRRFDGGMLQRNHPTEDNKQDVETMKSIISCDFNIRGEENAEKKMKRKIKPNYNKKPVEQDMAVTEEKEEEKKSKVNTEELRGRISKFISEILNGDEDKFEDIFIGYINGERTRDSIIDELGGREWSGILPYFKHAISIACDISPEEGEILKSKFESLPPLKEHIDLLEFAKEYKKVESGEELERDVLDHLYITKRAFNDTLIMYKGSNNNKPVVGGEEKVSRRKRVKYDEKVASEVFDLYLSGERQNEIGSKYDEGQRWVSYTIASYLERHPDRQEEYDNRKDYNKSHIRINKKNSSEEESTPIVEEPVYEDCDHDETENIKNECSESSSSYQKEQIEEITVKSAEVPNVNSIFESSNTIEVNLYKTQPNFVIGGISLFPNKLKFFNNMEEEDVKDYIKVFLYNHIRFDENNAPKTDIILYVGSASDYKLVMPVVDICSKLKVIVAVNEYDDSNKRYKFVYSTGRPSKDDDSNIMFAGCNRVEGLGCTLEDIINTDHLYEMKEVLYNSNGEETYVYKLLAVDNVDYLRRVYASEVSNMILNNKNQISVSICECSIEDGKLVDGEQNESYKKV